MSIIDSDQYFPAVLSSSGIVDHHEFTTLSGVSCLGHREFMMKDNSLSEAEFISRRLESNRVTGGDRFVKEIEPGTGIRLEFKRPGRPPWWLIVAGLTGWKENPK